MGKPAFTIKELIPNINKSSRALKATGRLDGILTLKIKDLNEGEILQKFETAINRASGMIAIDLKSALDDAMRLPIWDGGDIIDTGELLSSGIVTFDNSGIKISYNSPYAAIVHYGGYIHPYGNRSVTVYMPPRPWLESVLFGGAGLQPFNFARYYEQEIAKEFRG